MLQCVGANIIAIDLDREGIWKRLIGLAKNSSGSMYALFLFLSFCPPIY